MIMTNYSAINDHAMSTSCSAKYLPANLA